MMTLEALKLLKHIHAVWPDPLAVDYDHAALPELRDLGFVDLWDLGPKGEARWTVTTEGQSALKRATNIPG